MSRRAAALVPLTIAAAIALTACATLPGHRVPGPAATQAATNAPSATSTPSVYDDATTQPAPAATTAAESSAITAADKVMTTYAQPRLTPEAWAQQMTPLLSQSGAIAYEGQDPTTIPATKITGDGKILPGATNVALTVQVPTDAGDYTVALSRSGDSAPWLADEIRPVNGE